MPTESHAVSAAVRCESCGGPSPDGTLWASCQQAFHPFLENSPAAPVEAIASLEAAAPGAPVVPVEIESEEAKEARLKAEAAKQEAARKIAAAVVADRAAAAAKRERETLAKMPRLGGLAPAAPPPAAAAKPSPNRTMLLSVAGVAILGIIGFTERDLLMETVRPFVTPATAVAKAPTRTLTVEETFAMAARAVIPPAERVPAAP